MEKEHCPKCGKLATGYYHEGPYGCGLNNKIRIKTDHIHYYCSDYRQCTHEWTKEK